MSRLWPTPKEMIAKLHNGVSAIYDMHYDDIEKLVEAWDKMESALEEIALDKSPDPAKIAKEALPK